MLKNMLKDTFPNVRTRGENREDSDTEEKGSEVASEVCIFQSI